MKPKKILHLTTHLNIGGITTYILTLAQQMLSRGYEISVLSSGGNMTHQFNQLGIQTFELPIRTKSELAPRIYFSIPHVVKLLRKEKFDLLHAHTRVTQVMSWWIKRLTGMPYVSTCHGFYKKRLGRLLLPGWGDYVIAISPPVADHLLQGFHVPQEKVKTILNAVQIHELEQKTRQKNPATISKKLGLSSSHPVLGIISRLVYDKGHEYLLKALGDIKKKYPDVKLLIVGEGPFESQIRRAIKEFRVSDNVVMIGNLTDVTEALCVIDIFVLPAIWREGFGLSIVEAMALKKPVVVTNIWALNALIHNRIDGLMVEPKDAGLLANAIIELMENENLRREIGEQAYQMASREFSIDRMAEEVGNLYQDVLSSRPNGKVQDAIST